MISISLPQDLHKAGFSSQVFEINLAQDFFLRRMNSLCSSWRSRPLWELGKCLWSSRQFFEPAQCLELLLVTPKEFLEVILDNVLKIVLGASGPV